MQSKHRTLLKCAGAPSNDSDKRTPRDGHEAAGYWCSA